MALGGVARPARHLLIDRSQRLSRYRNQKIYL